MTSDDEPTPTADERVIISSKRGGPPDLRFLHYNDVYHVEPGSREPVGGIARFQTLCNYYRGDKRFHGQVDLITLFSGDAFNPSLESSVTKGSHMVPVLNAIGTDCACVGNHDLDFGVPQFRHLASQCTFPWLIANVLDPALGPSTPLGNRSKTLLLTSSSGIKIGLIGLVEREWLDTINSLPPNLIYKSASATAKELVPELRAQGAEFVIAITHQREPNDNKLAEKTPAGLIDLVLGGHDHFYQHNFINGTHVLRSGSDFKQLSYIEARRENDGSQGWDINIRRRDIVRSIPEDPATIKLVENLTSNLKSKLEKPIGYTFAPLDARFTTVRLSESNLGNFVADLMCLYYGADCCIMAAGTIRGDQIYPPGVLRIKDILNCFPFEDPVVVLRVSGKAIWDALENAVSKWPALEGRFPQVSNITFEFDPSKGEGERVKWARIGDDRIDFERKYVLSTRGYMARGKGKRPADAPLAIRECQANLLFLDGFHSLLIESEGGQAEEVVSEENGVLISMILRQYFMSLKVLGRWGRWSTSMDRHWSKVDDELHAHHPVKEPKMPDSAAEKPSSNQPASSDHVPLKPLPSLVGSTARDTSQHDDGIDQDQSPLSDSEDDEPPDLGLVGTDSSERENQLVIMRKVIRKWWRLAGLKGEPQMMDGDEGELAVPWTKGIAPRIEGRIRRTGAEHSVGY